MNNIVKYICNKYCLAVIALLSYCITSAAQSIQEGVGVAMDGVRDIPVINPSTPASSNDSVSNKGTAGLRGGKLGGPRGSSKHTVKANGSDTYNITFRGGEPVTIIVLGDGDTDLDLYVYDKDGNLIADDTDDSDNCVINFTPDYTGNFRVRIVNRGKVYNAYILHTRQ